MGALRFSPALVLWVVFNEAWGQHATSEYVQLVRRLDPTRLVTDASGWMSANALSGGQSAPTPEAEAAPADAEAEQPAAEEAANGCKGADGCKGGGSCKAADE